MGLFTNDRVPNNALPALAQVLDLQASGSQRQFGGGIPEQKVQLTLEVRVEGWPPYHAFAEHYIPLTVLSQLSAGAPIFLAAWVDPTDPQRVVIDLNQPPPTVTTAPTPGRPSAAELLATGNPAEAVIQQFSPLPMRNPAGHPIFAFSLAVMPPGYAPFLTSLGHPVPPEAFPLLFPGSRVPVALGPTQTDVAINWAGALGQAGSTAGNPGQAG